MTLPSRQHSSSPIRRDPHWLAFAFLIAGASWGLAAGIALVPLWHTPAPLSQPVGFMKEAGLNAHGPIRALLTLIVLPFAGAIAGRLIHARLAPGRALPWAPILAIVSLFASLWIALVTLSLSWTLLAPALACAAAVGLRAVPLRFTRDDIVLFPVMVTVQFALLDILAPIDGARAVVLSIAIVLILRVLVTVVPGPLSPALSFFLAPLGLVLQTDFFRYETRHLGWPSLLVAIATPPLMRLWRGGADGRTARRLLMYLVYPVFCLCYPMAASVSGAEGLPRVDFFERGHSLFPASEMMRGALPYRDVTPGHGLIEDGLLDYAALRFKGNSVGDVLELRGLAAVLNGPAIYAVAFAATGVPGVGILALFATAGIFGIAWLRCMPSLFALALAAGALRNRREALMAAASAVSVVAFLTSLEFGVFAFGTVVVAVLLSSREWRRRLRFARYAAYGALAICVPVALVFAIMGILVPFFRVTFGEVLPLSAVYSIGFFSFPEGMQYFRAFPDAFTLIFDRNAFPALIWPVVVVLTAAMAVSALRFSRRVAPLILIGVWIALAGITHAERHHFYFIFAVGAFLAVLFWIAWRSGRSMRVVAAVIFVVTLIAAHPTGHLSSVDTVRGIHGPLGPGWTEVWDVPRARHALFPVADAEPLRRLHQYVSEQLRPDETFFDFTNLPIVYFLLDRRAPIRQYEVPFYQTEELQREVIHRLESDKSVRLALMGFPGHGGIDIIPNEKRVPLVWAYLQTHFEPAYDEGGLVVWKRRGERAR